MNKRHKHLRTVEGGQSDGSNKAEPRTVPLGTFKNLRQEKQHHQRAANRRADIIRELLKFLSPAQRERIIGAGLDTADDMSERDFGEFLGRVKAAARADP
jgi:hypothetical protein